MKFIKGFLKLYFNSLMSIVVSVVLILFFTLLLGRQLVSDTTFLLLTSLSILVGFIIYFHDAIESLNLKEIKITLRKVEKVKSSIENLAESIAEIVSTLSVYSTGSAEARKELNMQEDFME